MEKTNKGKQFTKKIETAFFGGGCFWCTEAIFTRLKGVIIVIPGYAGGYVRNPDYKKVSCGCTGHAEVVKINYDSAVIGFNDLLEVFFSTHDPTALNRQGDDIGEQYRSIILYQNEQQKKAAEDFIGKLAKEKIFDKPIVTKIEPLVEFYPAEDYHRNYYKENISQPYCQAVISPKVSKFKAKFQYLLKR